MQMTLFCNEIALYNLINKVIGGDMVLDVNKKIEKMCFERGWSTYALSQYANLPYSTLQSLDRRKSIPKIEILEAICDAFGITLSQFFLEDEEMEVLSADEKELVTSFRRLPREKQEALLKLIDR